MKYYFDDFTTDNYRKIIKQAKSNYSFEFYKKDNIESGSILWRHDIDFSVHRALRLAKIESEEEVCSTYFVMLSCQLYNVFEKEVKQKLKEIISMGHEIGVHFDASCYGINDVKTFEKQLSYERDIIKELLGTNIRVFSFHNPNAVTAEFEDSTYAGLINVYSKYYKNLGYCSDSNGYWRYDRLSDVLNFAKHDKMQVLTHPAWWQEEIMPPRDRISRCIDGRAEAIHNEYDSQLVNHGRENITGEL